MNKTFRILLSGLIVAFFLLMTVCTIAVLTQHRAQRLVKVLQGTRVGPLSFEEFVAIQRRFPRDSSLSGECNVSACDVKFDFRNSWLSHLHLSTPAYLTGSLSYRGGQVVSIVLDAGCYPEGGGAAPYSVGVWESTGPAFTEPYWIGGKEGTIGVQLNSSASPARHLKAFSMDTRFLSRLGACSGPDQMLMIGREKPGTEDRAKPGHP